MRRRLPWLLVNLVIGLLIATVIGPFRSLIEQNGILAVLMPMVALLGGNSGAQSLAVIIRAMAVGDLQQERERVTVSDAELQAHYDANRDAFARPALTRLAMLLK